MGNSADCHFDQFHENATAPPSQNGNIEASLEAKSLWDEFYHTGTEMIVNRAGRSET